LKKEADALKEIKQAMGTSGFARKVFEKVFNMDIQRLLSMSDMWKSRTPPTSLAYSNYTLPSDEEIVKIAMDDQKIWDLEANIAVFKHRSDFPLEMILMCSLDRLSQRWKAIQKPDAIQVLTFDKDDMDTLDFVTATSNIRSTIFSIPTKSKFDIKRTAPAHLPLTFEKWREILSRRLQRQMLLWQGYVCYKQIMYYRVISITLGWCLFPNDLIKLLLRNP
jgi:ubiquitin-like 1-activating enzyme E1 B